MVVSTIGIISLYLIFMALFVLLTVYLVSSIIVMKKANKALSVWLKKNDPDEIKEKSKE